MKWNGDVSQPKGARSARGNARIFVGDRWVGDGERVFTIAEIGINHNGSLDLARRLVEAAHAAGCDAVKFQKRSPEHATPVDQWALERDTPWGRIPYIEYRRRVELSRADYAALDALCSELGILWFASCWDEPSVDFIESFDPPCYKVASASLTDHGLLARLAATNKPLFVSTGMSTTEEIELALAVVGRDNVALAQSTSAYPCKPEELNLRVIESLKGRYPDVPIGYSGHETGIVPSIAAVALGATFVERHFTLDRAMWGTDQAASLEPGGLARLVEGIRDVERALGDGHKRVFESERAAWAKLRRVRVPPTPV
jgi:N-acetylneuraminate synthase